MIFKKKNEKNKKEEKDENISELEKTKQSGIQTNAEENNYQENQIIDNDNLDVLDEISLRNDPELENENETSEYLEDNNETKEEKKDGLKEVEKFLKTFSQDQKEEIEMNPSLETIYEDIVLEDNKKKISLKPFLIAFVFVFFISLSFAISFVLSMYNIISGYNIKDNIFYNDNLYEFSVSVKGNFCDINDIKEDDIILYTDGDLDSTFGDYKALKIEEIRKSTIYGYDFKSKTYKEISIEKLCYILNNSKEFLKYNPIIEEEKE